MPVCFLSERSAQKIRRVTTRNDLIDASCYIDGDVAVTMPIFVSVRLVERLKRLGTQNGIEKLKQVVSRGLMVMRHNNGNRKSNFIVDLVPTEFFTVGRYYGNQQPGLVIDCEPLHVHATAELQLANG